MTPGDSPMIEVGSIVEWDTMLGDTERGIVIAIIGAWATVEYGPWGDRMDAPLSKLRPWTREEPS